MIKKLLNEVKESGACKLAYYKPAKEIEGDIADLHSLLSALPTIFNAALSVHYVDRKVQNIFEDIDLEIDIETASCLRKSAAG